MNSEKITQAVVLLVGTAIGLAVIGYVLLRADGVDDDFLQTFALAGLTGLLGLLAKSPTSGEVQQVAVVNRTEGPPQKVEIVNAPEAPAMVAETPIPAGRRRGAGGRFAPAEQANG